MQCCGGEVYLQCPFFQVIFTTHLPTDIIKCLQEMMVQPVPIKTSKLTLVSISHRNTLLCLLQAERFDVVIYNDLC